MTAELRMLVIAFAVFAGVGLVMTMLVPAVAGRWTRASAARRAERLAHLRLLPTLTAALSSLIVLAAFARFEPRWDGEEIGIAIPVLAAFGAVLLLTSAWRGFRLVRATRATVGTWLRTAEPIELSGISARAFAVDTEFPVVTVVGFRRPQLIIARSVLDSCSPEELRAILAHEQGHINRRDNLRRLLIAVAPDILQWLPVSARLSSEWREAAEDAADDDAARSGTDGSIRLAAALLKVARLAPGSEPPAPMPASALYRGESLERRVRRLLSARDTVPAPTARSWSMKLAVGLIVTGSLSVLENVHGLVEGLIHSLP